MEREIHHELDRVIEDFAVRQSAKIAAEVLRRAGGRCEGIDWDGEKCSVPAEECAFHVAREYGYSDAVEHGPLTARWVILLCEDCYEQSDDGQREAYEEWVMAQDD